MENKKRLEWFNRQNGEMASGHCYFSYGNNGNTWSGIFATRKYRDVTNVPQFDETKSKPLPILIP